MPKIDVEQFLAERKAEGLKIDPRTAEATWYYGYIVDPYGVCGDLPPEAMCVGRLYFARVPESDIWVSFYDLPQETRDAIWKRQDAFTDDLPYWD